MTMNWDALGKAARTVSLCAVLSGLAACGVKSSPAVPSDSTFPRQYPAVGEKTVIGTSAATDTEIRENAGAAVQSDSGAARSPLGFPLEYPNRPSYK